MKYFTLLTAAAIFFAFYFTSLEKRETQLPKDTTKNFEEIEMIDGRPVQFIDIKDPMAISPSR